MLGFVRLQHKSASSCMLRLVSFALALVAASAALAPSLLQSPSLALSTLTRVKEQNVPECIPGGQKVVLGITPNINCPCLVRFALRGKKKGYRPSGRILDFLIVKGEEEGKIRSQPGNNISYVDRYSITGAEAKRLNGAGVYEFVSPGFEITDNNPYALVVRSSSPVKDCDLVASYVLETVPVQCPRRLEQGIRTAILPVQEQNTDTVLAPLVVGGSPPTYLNKLFMVSFVRSNGLFCSGSYVAPGWVLTAAHCRIARGDKAFVGGFEGFSGSEREVANVIPHQLFDFSETNGPYDIALVQLGGPPPKNARAIPINSKPSLPAEMSYVRIAGYGRISEGFSSTDPPSLRTVDLPVVPMDVCLRGYNSRSVDLPLPLNPNVQLCAGYLKGKCDACQGDSGGPVTVLDANGNSVQVGIVSFGMGCARGGVPGVYTRIAPLVPWIQANLPTVKLSTAGVVVRAVSLNASVDPNAPSSGTGSDGLDPDREIHSEEFVGDSKIARLLKVVVPSVIGGVTVIFFILACLLCFFASRWREKTMSDHATGRRTKTIDDNSVEGIEIDVEASSYGGFSDFEGLEMPSPPRLSHPQPPPQVYVAPKKKFSLRKTKPEIIRMPDLRPDESSRRAVVGESMDKTPSEDGVQEEADPVPTAHMGPPLQLRRKSAGRDQRSMYPPGVEEEEIFEKFVTEQAIQPIQRGTRRSQVSSQSPNLQTRDVETGDIFGTFVSEEPLPPRQRSKRRSRLRLHSQEPETKDVPEPPLRARRDLANPLQAEDLPNVDNEQLQAEEQEPPSVEEVEERGRRERNAFFDDRYPTPHSSTNFLFPSFDDIVPERSSSRGALQFRDELHEQTFDR